VNLQIDEFVAEIDSRANETRNDAIKETDIISSLYAEYLIF